MDFHDLVTTRSRLRWIYFVPTMEAGELDQYLFFNGISEMIGDGSDEGAVMMACIELGRCAFWAFALPPRRRNR